MPSKKSTPQLSDEEIIAQFAAILTRLVTQEIPEDDEADDDEDVEEVEDDEEEDDDEEEADEDEESEDADEDTLWDQESLEELDRDDLKALADEYEIEYTAKTAGKTLIKAILEAQDAEIGADEPEDDDEEEDEDDESEFWTEKELKGKPLAELRTIAKEYDIPVKGKSEKDLIKAIVNA